MLLFRLVICCCCLFDSYRLIIKNVIEAILCIMKISEQISFLVLLLHYLPVDSEEEVIATFLLSFYRSPQGVIFYSCLSDSTIVSIFFALIIKRHYRKRKRLSDIKTIINRCLIDVMSTIESNTKNHPIISASASLSSQPVVVPPPLLLPTTSLPSTPTPFYDDKSTEKLYKKPKQISLEFDQIVKGIKILIQ
jgi:hypothetical protein